MDLWTSRIAEEQGIEGRRTSAPVAGRLHASLATEDTLCKYWVFHSFRLDGKQPRASNDNNDRLVDDDPRRFGFHNLRHSLASFLIRIRTDPKTVQTLLRHSDVKLTLQFYTHAVSRDRMAAAGKMLTAVLSHAANESGLKAD